MRTANAGSGALQVLDFILLRNSPGVYFSALADESWSYTDTATIDFVKVRTIRRLLNLNIAGLRPPRLIRRADCFYVDVVN